MLLQALPRLPPWVAAWHRTVRKMVRLKLKDTETHAERAGETPLSEMFSTATGGAALMNRAQFDRWSNQSGYTTSTVSWLGKRMSEITQARTLQISALSCARSGVL